MKVEGAGRYFFIFVKNGNVLTLNTTRATPGKPLERHRDGATTANFLIFRVRHQKLAGFHGGTLFYTTIKL